METKRKSKLRHERMLVTDNLYGSLVRIDNGKGGGPRRISAPNVRYKPEGETEPKYGTLYTVPEALTAALQLVLQSVEEMNRQSAEYADWKRRQPEVNGTSEPTDKATLQQILGAALDSINEQQQRPGI